MKIVCLVFAFVISYSSSSFIDNDQVVGSPLRVAQCRATCLQKFSPEHLNEQSTCLQEADCYVCWENCQLLQSNFQFWSDTCEDKDICFPGCQTACDFHSQVLSKGAQQAQPVIRTQGESAIRVRAGRARWPRPGVVARETPLVYVVMQRRDGAAWRQLAQTATLNARVPPSTATVRPLRVLAVAPHGLVAIYSPVEEETNNLRTISLKKNTKNDLLKSNDLNKTLNGKWQLHEISLIHQKFLVISEIAWDVSTPRGVYLVTWEVDGGGLKGNLFTDSTSVTLSLWPDTVYHIQVELVSNKSKEHNLKSEILDLDTGKSHVTVESDFTLDDELTNLRERNYRNVNALSVLMERGNLGVNMYSEVVVGSLAAVVVFVLVLIGFFCAVRRRGANKIEASEDTTSSLESLPKKGDYTMVAMSTSTTEDRPTSRSPIYNSDSLSVPIVSKNSCNIYTTESKTNDIA